jgi:prepilin-type N-terminal cleavage/methylation domain-containing protein
MRRARRRARGFTLMELMVTLAVSSIVMAMITWIVYSQTRSFGDQMTYSEAQQNARASIALLKRYARNAGWGMEAGPDALGVIPFGACHQDPPNELLSTTNCNNVDIDNQGLAGTDRLRIVGMQQQNGGTVFEQPFQITAGSIPVALLTDPETLLALLTPAGHPYGNGELVLLSGPCKSSTAVATDLLRIDGSTGVSLTHFFTYSYTNLFLGSTTLSCNADGSDGYDLGHSIGRALVADFFVDRASDPAHPALKLRLDPQDPLSGAFVVAHDIDDFQVQLFVDTQCTDPSCLTATDPDHVWDTVCNGPGEGFCDQAISGFTVNQILARVIGARIALVTRTRANDPRWKRTATNTITVQDNPSIGDGDGYRRWIYRATVMLRNNEL